MNDNHWVEPSIIGATQADLVQRRRLIKHKNTYMYAHAAQQIYYICSLHIADLNRDVARTLRSKIGMRFQQGSHLHIKAKYINFITAYLFQMTDTMIQNVANKISL